MGATVLNTVGRVLLGFALALFGTLGLLSSFGVKLVDLPRDWTPVSNGAVLVVAELMSVCFSWPRD